MTFFQGLTPLAETISPFQGWKPKELPLQKHKFILNQPIETWKDNWVWIPEKTTFSATTKTGWMKPIKPKKIIKRNPVAKALGELGYATKVKPSKKIYKRARKKPLVENDGQADET